MPPIEKKGQYLGPWSHVWGRMGFCKAFDIGVAVVLLCLFLAFVNPEAFGKESSSTPKPVYNDFYLKQCENRCNSNQRCFLGVCYCLPGRGGPDCSQRKIYPSLNPDFCPMHPDIKSVHEQKQFDYPVKHCGIDDRDPVSCAVFCNWQEDAGMIAVGPNVWNTVQDSEMDFWKMVKPGPAKDIPEIYTRWIEFTQGFEGFEGIPHGYDLGNYMEVGAGMFSQVYNLLDQRPDLKVKTIYLLEPNVERYLDLPACLFRDGTLHGHPIKLISKSTEESNLEGEKFDTIAVINVIEHVVDGFDFLTSVYEMLRPGGMLIFSERYHEVPEGPGSKWLGKATLHPVRARKNVFHNFLRLFEPDYVGDWATEKSYNQVFGGHGYFRRAEEGYYFIGRKKLNMDTSIKTPADLERIKFQPKKHPLSV